VSELGSRDVAEHRTASSNTDSPVDDLATTALATVRDVTGEIVRLVRSAATQATDGWSIVPLARSLLPALERVVEERTVLGRDARAMRTRVTELGERIHELEALLAAREAGWKAERTAFEDDVARDPRIDELRKKMTCVEDKGFSRDYHDPAKRSIANALTVEFKDGTKLKEVVCEYPIGHKRRRKEGMPVLVEKFKTNLARRFSEKQQRAILDLCQDVERLHRTPVNEFVDLFVA